MYSAAPGHRASFRLRTGLRFALLASAVILASSCLTPEFSGLGGPPVTTGGAPSGGAPPASGGLGGAGGTPVAEHCKNGVLEESLGETDKDCGGECAPCDLDRHCLYSTDCASNNCVGGICTTPSCHDTAWNQDETDVDCGGIICDGCAERFNCNLDRDCESQNCSSGNCVSAACDDDRKNNDETDVDCGGTTCPERCDVGMGCKLTSDCMPAPGEDAPMVRCVEPPGGAKVCQLDCPPRTGDCDELAMTGCEIKTETSLTHCGGCDQKCDPAHTTTPVCESGMCGWDRTLANDGCDAGYADCDGKPENGCEANLKTDAGHCGTCDTECASTNGTAACKSGSCQITCSAGFKDCDGDPGANGCETNIQTSVDNCGGCGEVDAAFVCLPKAPSESAFCSSGVCGSIDCGSTGYGACNGDGVCDVPLSTTDDCGKCGNQCAAVHGTATCATGAQNACGVGSCDPGYSDCDLDYDTGCEVDIRTDSMRCGGCLASDPKVGTGQDCQALADNAALHVADAACSDSACEVVCDPGYGDCDGDPANGCEVALDKNATRCGGCLPTDPNPDNGENCKSKWPNGSVSTCSGDGTCQLACDTGYDDCGGTANGCETNVTSSKQNCGECNVYCGGDASQTNVSSASCTAAACVVSCMPGFCPNLADPERTCTGTLGTVQNCASCGDACGGPGTPFCDVTGIPTCRQHPVKLIQTKPEVAAMSGQTRTITVNNVAAAGEGRMLLVIVTSTSAISAANLGGVPMTLLGTTALGDNQQGVVAGYYVLDSALGAAGTKTITITNGWGYHFVSVYELKYAAQSVQSGLAWAATSSPTDCSGVPLNLQTAATITEAGGAIFAGVFAQAGTAAAGAPIGGLTEISETSNSNQGTGIHGYKVGIAANTPTTFGWALTGSCWASGLGAAVISPLIVP